jgi:putative transposase
MVRQAYPSDVSDSEWNIIEPLLPKSKLRGRKRTSELREVVNAIFYLREEGCQWRALPHDFPHWSTVRTDFDKWNKNQVWYQMNRVLRAEVRQQQGRESQPSAASIDSQSVKTTQKRGKCKALTVEKRSKVGSVIF